jgi:hypothetical protein
MLRNSEGNSAHTNVFTAGNYQAAAD